MTEINEKKFNDVFAQSRFIKNRFEDIYKKNEHPKIENFCEFFIGLRSGNRQSQLFINKTREETQKKKAKIEEKNLKLQNLQYELNFLKKEVKKCLDYKSLHEKLELDSTEKFLTEAPPDLRKSAPITKYNSKTESDDHQSSLNHSLTLARLEWELRQRKELKLKNDRKIGKIEKIEREIQKKKDTMNAILPKLSKAVEVSSVLEQALHLDYSLHQEESRLAGILPRPLSLLYHQCKSYAILNSYENDANNQLKITVKIEPIESELTNNRSVGGGTADCAMDLEAELRELDELKQKYSQISLKSELVKLRSQIERNEAASITSFSGKLNTDRNGDRDEETGKRKRKISNRNEEDATPAVRLRKMIDDAMRPLPLCVILQMNLTTDLSQSTTSTNQLSLSFQLYPLLLNTITVRANATSPSNSSKNAALFENLCVIPDVKSTKNDEEETQKMMLEETSSTDDTGDVRSLVGLAELLSEMRKMDAFDRQPQHEEDEEKNKVGRVSGAAHLWCQMEGAAATATHTNRIFARPERHSCNRFLCSLDAVQINWRHSLELTRQLDGIRSGCAANLLPNSLKNVLLRGEANATTSPSVRVTQLDMITSRVERKQILSNERLYGFLVASSKSNQMQQMRNLLLFRICFLHADAVCTAFVLIDYSFPFDAAVTSISSSIVRPAIFLIDKIEFKKKLNNSRGYLTEHEFFIRELENEVNLHCDEFYSLQSQSAISETSSRQKTIMMESEGGNENASLPMLACQIVRFATAFENFCNFSDEFKRSFLIGGKFLGNEQRIFLCQQI